MKRALRTLALFVALFMSAVCLPLCISMCPDIIWMLTSEDNATPPWEVERQGGAFVPKDEDAEDLKPYSPMSDDTPGPTEGPSLDESGPAGVTR
jgi:hypothetical protein